MKPIPDIIDTFLPTLDISKCLLCALERGHEHEDTFAPNACVEREQDRAFLLGCVILSQVLVLGGMTVKEAGSLVALVAYPCLTHAKRLEDVQNTLSLVYEQAGANLLEVARNRVSSAMATAVDSVVARTFRRSRGEGS